MKERSTFIRGFKESYLHVKTYEPSDKQVKCVLHILHGMGEYGERYRDFAAYLVDYHFAVVVHDHRKHGKSVESHDTVGILGKHDTHINMSKDIDYVQDYLRGRYKDVPVYMLGHSMGSILLRYYLTQTEHDVEKAILMGTLPKYSKMYIKAMRFIAFISSVFTPMKKRHRKLAKLLNDGLAKKIPDSKTRLDWLSHNEVNVKRYIEDPLCGYAYNKRFYRSFFKLVDIVNQKATIEATKAVPLMLISGTDDPLNTAQVALDTVHKGYEVAFPNNSIFVHQVKDARHEVLNEKNPKPTYTIIREWLEQ